MVELTVTVPKDGPARLIVEPTAFELEKYGKLRPGKLACAEISYPRNLKHLRWYWALLTVVADGLGWTAEGLHVELKKRTDFIREVLLLPGGNVFVQYESIKMRGGIDESRFTEYRIRAVNTIFHDADLLQGVRRKDVWKRVEKLVGPCPW